MKSGIRTLVFSLACALSAAGPTAHAFGSKKPASGDSSSSSNVVIDLGLNIAITYAKMDPKYNTILTALGINSAADVRGFLQGNKDGTNFRNIIAQLAFSKAQSDPKVKAAFSKLGITDITSLRNFIKNQSGSSGFEQVLNIALQQAISNPKYAVWLDRLNINDVQDLRNLLKGGKSGNLQSLVLTIGLNYVASNPKFEKYQPLIQAAMMTLGLSQGSDGTGNVGSDDDIIDLGSFAGMTVGETRLVRSTP